MRVEYTIPGWDPGARARAGGAPAPAESGFHGRLRKMNRGVPPTAHRLLRLDRPAVTAATLGPPPRPASLEIGDAVSERQVWHGMLGRLNSAGEGQDARALPEKSHHAVERMMGLLVRYQELQDDVVARLMTAREV